MYGSLKILLLFVSLFAAGITQAQMLEKPFPAPDFTLTDMNGQQVSLHSFKGKVVLVDFWASWCAPCRVTNRQLAGLYGRYHDKGFEIVSVSVDTNPKRWKRAVARDKMVWPQLIDDSDPQKNIAYRWQITSIPRSFLINDEGKFVGVNLDVPALEDYLQLNLK